MGMGQEDWIFYRDGAKVPGIEARLSFINR